MRTRTIVSFCLLGILAYSYYASTAIPNVPELKDGDLVFQTTINSQSGAIMAATGSLLTHVGIVKLNGDTVTVIEAADTVIQTDWSNWVDYGAMNRVAIYRYPDLTSEQTQQILSAASNTLGRTYDIFFSFNNNEKYCSEIPYEAFKSAGLQLGTVQKISQLNVDNSLVKDLIEQRWRVFPDCTDRNYNFEQCYAHIMNQELISPASIAHDQKLEKIFDNYF